MESQLVRPNGMQQQQQQQESHDKNSVLNKVKAKARNMKETISRRARGREHCHEDDYQEDVPDDHDLDEEEDDQRDEETLTVTDLVVRSVPIDSPMSGEPVRVKSHREEVIPALAATPDSVSSAAMIDRGPHWKLEEFVRAPGAEEGLKSPARMTDPGLGKFFQVLSIRRWIVGPLDRHQLWDLRSKYYSILTCGLSPNLFSTCRLIGSEEADVSQLIKSIGKMTIEAGPETRAEGDSTPTSMNGSHDDGKPSPETVWESISSEDESEKRASGSSYTEKIFSVTAAIADKATSAKDVMASKLGFAQKPNTEEISMKDPDNAAAQAEQTAGQPPVRGITALVTEKLSPGYEKVVETGSVVVSKVGGSGSDTGAPTGGNMEEKGLSMKEYVAEKLKPGEEDKALSKVISDALRERKEGMGKAAEVKVGGAVGRLLGKSARTRASGSGANEEGEDPSEAVANTEDR